MIYRLNQINISFSEGFFNELYLVNKKSLLNRSLVITNLNVVCNKLKVPVKQYGG